MMREGISPETNRRRAEAMRSWDVTGLLPQVRAETLVLQRRELGWLDLSIGRGIAAAIPNARLVVLEGSSVPPFLGDVEDVVQAADSFLREVGAQAVLTSDSHAVPELPEARAARSDQLAARCSARQREVLSMIARGMTNREIASELVLSLRTVERHVNDIYARLGVRNRTEAVARALKHEE